MVLSEILVTAEDYLSRNETSSLNKSGLNYFVHRVRLLSQRRVPGAVTR